ncbi:MAG TPA: RsmE family RNA methyltransferase [Dehalococcoidia bacterium]|nr:RsmE family RNA methyltransferase [Dehalococcoidia bacterium]
MSGALQWKRASLDPSPVAHHPDDMSQPLRRFFVPPGSLRARNVTLGPDLAHRLGRVLRLKRGGHILLSVGGARDYEVQLTGVSPYAITGVVISEREAPPEPQLKLVLYQSLIRANRFDLVLEKGTEIGVSRFAPVIAARSQVQGNGEPSTPRSERWERIVIEAAEQCGRGRLPIVDPALPFESAVRQARGLKVLPFEGERRRGISAYLGGLSRRPDTVSLFIGPEGGFDDAEVERAREAGAEIVSLGPRILRSETAGIVAAALVLNALGEIG